MRVADEHRTRWENACWTDGQRFFLVANAQRKEV